MRNIAVYTGGYSSEAPVSRKSAKTVINILKNENVEVFVVDINDDSWTVKYNDLEFPYQLYNGSLLIEDDAFEIDFAYIIVHGKPGENGQLQGYLDLHEIPYQTGNHLNMALSFSKKNTTAFLQSMNVPVAKSAFGHSQVELIDGIKVLGLKYPLFIKPDDAGSSFGVSKVKTEAELMAALDNAFNESDSVMAEEMIVGREFTCGVFQKDGIATALPVTEIVTQNEFFDYAAKYENQSEEITPAKIAPASYEAMQKRAVNVYELLSCDGICRVDFICEIGKEPVVIEINTIPGLTEASIIPQMFRASKFNFEKAIVEMMN